MLMGANLPITSIHRQLASALDVIVHISRMPGGRRAVTQIAEVSRYDAELQRIGITDIFNYRSGAALLPTGYLPSFVDSLVEKELLDIEFLYGAPAGDAPGEDLQEALIRSFFRFMGLEDVRFVHAEGQGIDPGTAQTQEQRARVEIDRMIATGINVGGALAPTAMR